MRVPLIALLGVLLATTACGGGADPTVGMRVKLSDLDVEAEPGRKYRWLHGTCAPPGRLIVDFRPGKEVTIRNKGRLVGSLSSEEGFIGCRNARLEEPRRGQGWSFRQFSPDLRQGTSLVCVTDERIDLSVDPPFGGALYVSTPPHGSGSPPALIAASFDRQTAKWRLNYHIPRCRVVVGG